MGEQEFLGGAEGVVLTNAADMALVVCVSHDGAVDISCHVDNATAAAALRQVADYIENRPEGGPRG